MELATADFRLALDVARHARRDELRARAALGWSAASVVWGRQPELRAALQEALDAGLTDLALRAEVQARLAQVLYYDETLDRRAQLARAAIADARESGRPDTLATVLATTHAAMWGPRDLDQRRAVADEVVTVARTSGHPELEASGLGWLAADLLESGDLRGADQALRRHAELADRLRQRLLLRDAELWRGMRAILDGRFDAARSSIERARDLGEAARDRSSDTIYWVQRYWLACERGDRLEMDDLVEACERFVHVHADVPAWRAALAMLHARRRDHEAASEHYELLARDGFRAIPHDFVWLNAMTYMAETCAFLEDTERASMLSEILDPYANRVALIDRGLACKGSMLRFLGLLATVADDFDVAERHLSGALQRHEAMGAEPLVTRTREGLAHVRARRASSAAR
jgi:tetratricopeptide (TPR) repeat protein